MLVSPALVERVYQWDLEDNKNVHSLTISLINDELNTIAPLIVLTAGNDGLLRDSTRLIEWYGNQNSVKVSWVPDTLNDFSDFFNGKYMGLLLLYPGQVYSFFIARKRLSGGVNPLETMTDILEQSGLLPRNDHP